MLGETSQLKSLLALARQLACRVGTPSLLRDPLLGARMIVSLHLGRYVPQPEHDIGWQVVCIPPGRDCAQYRVTEIRELLRPVCLVLDLR